MAKILYMKIFSLLSAAYLNYLCCSSKKNVVGFSEITPVTTYFDVMIALLILSSASYKI